MDIQVNDLTIEQIKQFNPNLFKAIQESKDPDEEIQRLEADLEAQKTTNKELSEGNDTLREENKGLKTENETIKAKNDEFEAKEKMAAKVEMIDKLLKESELPKEMVTDYFREMLLKLDEEHVKEAIADRKKVTEKTGKVTDSGDEFDGGEKEKKEATETDKKAVIEAAKSQ